PHQVPSVGCIQKYQPRGLPQAVARVRRPVTNYRRRRALYEFYRAIGRRRSFELPSATSCVPSGECVRLNVMTSVETRPFSRNCAGLVTENFLIDPLCRTLAWWNHSNIFTVLGA